MKIKTNASKKKSSSSDKNDNPKVQNTETNPSYNVRQISNGWVASKSWSDKDGKYHSEEIYYKENPIKDTELL